MFELAFLGVIAVAFYRRLTRSRGWSRADLWRALTKLERRLRRGVVSGRQAGPGLMAQCAADLKNLGEDMLAVIGPEARARLRRSVRNRTSRPARGRVHRGDGAISDASDPAFARLQRRYLDGRISLEEYVEVARRLRTPPTPGPFRNKNVFAADQRTEVRTAGRRDARLKREASLTPNSTAG